MYELWMEIKQVASVCVCVCVQQILLSISRNWVGKYIGMSRNQGVKKHVQIPVLPLSSCAFWQVWQAANHLCSKFPDSKMRGWNLNTSKVSLNTTSLEIPTSHSSSSMNENSFHTPFYQSSSCFPFPLIQAQVRDILFCCRATLPPPQVGEEPQKVH